MSKDVKYVIVDTGLCECIIVFPDVIPHDMMLGACRNIVAAGFIHADDNGKFVCHGKSVGLGCPSRGEQDAAIAQRQLKFRGSVMSKSIKATDVMFWSATVLSVLFLVVFLIWSMVSRL